LAESRPWGGMDPNSANQLWSRWTFSVDSPRQVPRAEVELNTLRWLRAGFGSVGQAQVLERIERGRFVIVIEAEVENVPAHDPGYVASVRRAFARFVEQGWGVLALGTVEVKVLAGDLQDGKPRSQLVVMPIIRNALGRD